MLTLDTEGATTALGPRRRTLPAEAWLFPQLDPHQPPGRRWSDQAAYLREIARSLIETTGEGRDPDLDHPTLPAAYALLAEFVANELAPACARSDEGAVVVSGGFAPRLGLAGLYGSGPAQSYLYDQVSGDGHLLVDHPRGVDGDVDLPRNAQGRALVGEPRNDLSVLQSQLHLALIRFHNAVLDGVQRAHQRSDRVAFEEARRLVRWHFQWLVLHDLLPRLVGPELVDSLVARTGEPPAARLLHFGPRARSIVPLEFTLGAFLVRFSLYRSVYDVNDDLPSCPFLSLGAGGREDLRGLRPLPEGWSVQWDRFVEIDGSRPQRCRRLNTLLPGWMHRVPDPLGGRSLVMGALLRAWSAGLPSGQDVASVLGREPVRPGHDPLLLYALSEAEDPPNDGRLLVGVGARIVAETIVGVVATDPGSFLSREPGWRPTLVPRGVPFDLAALLRLAEVPLTGRDLPGERKVRILPPSVPGPERSPRASEIAEPA